MKITIVPCRNGLMVTIDRGPTASDPMSQDPMNGVWYARDSTDALGRIGEAVKGVFDPITDQLHQD